MIIEIPNTEMEAHAEACSLIELSYKFYPTEINGVVKIRVTDKGRDISQPITYRLARLVDQILRCDRERILEEELLQEPVNDVVIIVEGL